MEVAPPPRYTASLACIFLTHVELIQSSTPIPGLRPLFSTLHRETSLTRKYLFSRLKVFEIDKAAVSSYRRSPGYRLVARYRCSRSTHTSPHIYTLSAHTSGSMVTILVVNPNSTDAMTNSLRSEVESLDLPSSFQISYYTGPAGSSPPSINNQSDAVCSAKACIEDFDNLCPEIYNGYDGYLIACYSDHPLVDELREKINRPGVVVMGIFQASMLYAMNFASETSKAAILTSGEEWEPLLDHAILKFCASDTNHFPTTKFIPTLASGIPVLELHRQENYPHLKQSIQRLVNNDVGIVLLGCAGLSSLSNKMKLDFPQLKFVDSVKVGVRLIIAYIQVGDI